MNETPLRFFDPGTIVGPGGQAIAVRSRKQLALLVYLASEHQVPHSRATLTALFWPDETTDDAQNNLRVTLSRLRTLAERLAKLDPSMPALLLIDRHTVQLHPAWVDAVDTNRFRRLLDRTRQHEHVSRSQCADCQALLREAVLLFRNEFLAGFGLNECVAFEEWLFMQRERLRLLVLEAYSDLATFAEACGDLPSALAFAQCQIDLDSLRESAYRQQMRILARQGNRNAALARFERCRTVLREELGLDPEPETLALHGQLLDPSISGTLSDESWPRTSQPASVAPPLTHLPQQLTPFIGREEELAQFQQRLLAGDSRLFSIVGPGGIGKTRLALVIAAENLHLFAHGVCFVPLAGVQSVAAIPAAILDALGVSLATGAASPTNQLFALLADRQLLLVLDNFEQLIDGVTLLLELLLVAPQVTLLVTTRQQLNCQAEDLFILQGLPFPTDDDLAHVAQSAAARLFCDRAYRRTKKFRLTAENSAAVARICRLVEGLPLAIELATTWLREFDAADLVATLAADLSLLATSQQDVPVRHRSMQAVFDHSWQLLSAAEQRILSRLAVCPGVFAIPAVTALTGASLIELIHVRYKSLLRSAGSGYYEFHPLIRGFALAKLDSVERRTAEEQMATYYLRQVAEQSAQAPVGASNSAIQSIGRELDNVQHAWRWAEHHARCDLLLECIGGLGEFYHASGRGAQGEAIFLPLARRLLAQPAAAPLDETAKLLCFHLLDETCRSFYWQNNLPAAVTWSQTLVDTAQAAANHNFEARGYTHWGFALNRHGQNSAARQKFEQALRLARHLVQPQLLARILYGLGVTLTEMGDRGQGEICFQECLQIQRSQGNRVAEQRTLIFLSSMRLKDGDYQGGQRYLLEAEHLLQLTGSRPEESRIKDSLGYVEAMLGNYAAALDHHAAARRISQTIHEPVQESHALHHLCADHRKMGNLPAAEECGVESLRLALAHDLPDAASYARLHLGYVWLASGDLEEAAAAFQLAADYWRQQQRTTHVLEATVGLAAVAYQAGNLARAAVLITPFVPALLDHPPPGTDEPFEIYLTCCQVLTALHDPRAGALLRTAHTQLQALAGKITDRQQRSSFWQTSAHRKLRSDWRRFREDDDPTELTVTG